MTLLSIKIEWEQVCMIFGPNLKTEVCIEKGQKEGKLMITKYLSTNHKKRKKNLNEMQFIHRSLYGNPEELILRLIDQVLT